ncbi:MAG: hypothetical protein AAF629_14550 [Chloroflexota bacterium]
MTYTSDIPLKPTIACDLTAIDAKHRDEHITSGKALFAQVLEVQALPDGYALHLPSDNDTFLHTAQFISQERKCCSFFNFKMEIGSENEPFWLKITGPDGAKELLQNELGLQIEKT